MYGLQVQFKNAGKATPCFTNVNDPLEYSLYLRIALEIRKLSNSTKIADIAVKTTFILV